MFLRISIKIFDSPPTIVRFNPVLQSVNNGEYFLVEIVQMATALCSDCWTTIGHFLSHGQRSLSCVLFSIMSNVGVPQSV